MNKIGIFGDSFAVPHVTSEWGNYIHTVNWPKLLEAQTHAHGGTDIAYSFLEFEKHHSKYDQVIFVLTNPGRRITFMFEHSEGHIINSTSEGTSHSAIKRLKKSNDYDPKLHHLHSSIIDWHKMQGLDVFAERETLFCNLMVERIKQLRPDVKFIQAFTWNHTDHIGDNKYVPSTSCLIDISNYENKIFGWDDPTITALWWCSNKKEDIRVGHITSESHIILAELIKRWLKTDVMFFDFDIKEFHNIKPDEKRYNTALHKSYEDWRSYCGEVNE